jgi:hypothetical protein
MVAQPDLVTPVTEEAQAGLFNPDWAQQTVKGRVLSMSFVGPQAPSAKLVGKRVLLKSSLFSRAFSGTITAADEIGFCFLSDDLISALREITGSALASLEAPNVYLPFSTLEWLVFSDSNAAAASA